MYATDNDMSKANQDDCHLDRTNATQVATSSGASKDVYEENPFKRYPHNDGCGQDTEEDTVDEAKGKLTSNADGQDDDDDHDGRNALEGNAMELGVINEDPKEKITGL